MLTVTKLCGRLGWYFLGQFGLFWARLGPLGSIRLDYARLGLVI
jgi:hypothetical protein